MIRKADLNPFTSPIYLLRRATSDVNTLLSLPVCNEPELPPVSVTVVVVVVVVVVGSRWRRIFVKSAMPW